LQLHRPTAVRQVATAPPHHRQTLSCLVAVYRLSSRSAVRVLADVLYFVILKILIELLRKLLHGHTIILGHDAVSLSSRISTFRDVLISLSTGDLSFIMNHL
jgi:hypothetical protein